MVTVIPIVNGALGIISNELVKGMEDLEIRVQVEAISITKVGQNTEKSPRDFRRLAITQTPEKKIC